MPWKVVQEEQPSNPRRDWDPFGTMICFHRRYDLGDKTKLKFEQFKGWANLKAYLEIGFEEEQAKVILPLFLLDHSGLALRTGAFHEDPQGWDSGQVGFIYATKAQIEKEYGSITPETLAKAKGRLESEVKTYDMYLQGDVYCALVTDMDGEVVDSLGDIYGHEEAEKEAQRMEEALLKKDPDALKKQYTVLLRRGTEEPFEVHVRADDGKKALQKAVRGKKGAKPLCAVGGHAAMVLP